MNPKISLFFLAFLPQFANTESGNVAAQMVMLGLVFIVVTIVVFGAAGGFAGKVGQWLRTSPFVQRYLGWAAAGVFVALGVKLALAER